MKQCKQLSTCLRYCEPTLITELLVLGSYDKSVTCLHMMRRLASDDMEWEDSWQKVENLIEFLSEEGWAVKLCQFGRSDGLVASGIAPGDLSGWVRFQICASLCPFPFARFWWWLWMKEAYPYYNIYQLYGETTLKTTHCRNDAIRVKHDDLILVWFYLIW